MKTKFYVCEDVRQEVNNKLTIVGLYSDDVIIINKPEKQLIDGKEFEFSIITRMVILVTVYDFVGQVVLTGNFVSPKNELHSAPQELGSRELLQGQSHNFIFDVSGFPVIMDGIYTFKLKVNDEDFDYPIEIRYA